MADKRVSRFFGCGRLVSHIQRRLLPHIYFSDDPISRPSPDEQRLPLAAAWCHILPTDAQILSAEQPMAFTCLEPAVILEVQEATFGISSVIWDSKMGLLILGSSDFSFLSRLDSYLTNLRFPWEPAHVPIPMGRVSFWKYRPGIVKTSCLPPPPKPLFSLPCPKLPVSASMQLLDPLVSPPSDPTIASLERESQTTAESSFLNDSVALKTVASLERESPRFELIKYLDVQSQVTSLCFNAQQGHLFASLGNGKLEYFAVQSNTSLPSNMLPSDPPITSSSDDENGAFFVRLPPPSQHDNIQDVSLNCDPVIEFRQSTFPSSTNSQFPDISVFRQSSNSLGYLLPHHSDTLTCLTYDPTRFLLFSGSSDGSLKVYNFWYNIIMSQYDHVICPIIQPSMLRV